MLKNSATNKTTTKTKNLKRFSAKNVIYDDNYVKTKLPPREFNNCTNRKPNMKKCLAQKPPETKTQHTNSEKNVNLKEKYYSFLRKNHFNTITRSRKAKLM